MVSLQFHGVGISKIALIAVTGLALSACSGSVDRFDNYPNIATSSIDDDQGERVANDTVSSGALDNASIPQRPSWQQPANTASSWQQPAAPRTAYQQPSYRQPAAPQTTYRQPAAQNAGSVRVGPGQTLYSIARTNGMSVQQLAGYNGIPAPYTLRVGQVIRVPGTANAASQAATATPANTAPKAHTNYASASRHTVSAGQTLFAVGRQYGMNPYTIARHNGLAAPYHLSAGQVLDIPTGSSATAAQQQPAPSQVPFQTAPSRTAATEISATAPAGTAQQTPALKSDDRVQQTEIAQSDPVASDSGFRWPVRGRVISTYGQKPNGMRNEGINIAVPEGTSVRASEAGVVAYSGNELKGYGNLVLIRHSNGWVSAYAHNQDVFVKRGETVKRGDVIAKAGQTGSVTSPQLHFELRKGASAVDPMKYLASSQAAAD